MRRRSTGPPRSADRAASDCGGGHFRRDGAVARTALGSGCGGGAVFDRAGDCGSVACAGDAEELPYLDFTMHSAPGEYRGFLVLLRERACAVPNLRYPRDYNTVPRVFLAVPFAVVVPGSVYFPAVEAEVSRRRRARGCYAVLVLGGVPADVLYFSSTQNIIRCLAIRRWRC
jgi:hypothetical protein